VKPIPVQFHIGPLLLHTYGIGLAVTYWLAYRYFEHRLKTDGYPVDWVPGVFAWVVVSSIIGARIVHVLANWSYYQANPGQILAVWHGGLSSFGGLLFAVPLGTYLAVRRCPGLTAMKALDLVAPVLVLAWAIGRLLGPQLMFAGGGRETTAWYGMAYAGQAGKRVPVPLIQAFDCLVIYVILLQIEQRYRPRATGFMVATAATLYGLARFFEESLFLRQNDHLGGILVQAAGLGLVVAGAVWMMVLARRRPPAAEPAAGADRVVRVGSGNAPAEHDPPGAGPDPAPERPGAAEPVAGAGAPPPPPADPD
jgi:phosphatidylglycerol:prolipoprotein diacylglycerol transferase